MEAFDTNRTERVLDDAIARTEVAIERLHQRIDQLCQVLKLMTFDGSIKTDRNPDG